MWTILTRNRYSSGVNRYLANPTPGYVGQEIAVHRFYGPTLDRYFFSADQAEVDRIELTGVWNYEGIAFWGEVLGG